ncbi:hypothetical protein EXIGLDRAFT_574000, partial [Exidia glandulosa HHB12029]
PDHPDDVFLAGTRVSHLEHADDMALISSSPEGLQQKLDALATWAARNQMEINVKKTVVMMFHRPRSRPNMPPPVFSIYGRPLNIVSQQSYVGITFSSGTPNIWDIHFSSCASKARRAANMTFFVESHTGPIPPWECRTLYTAHVDPHLIWAAGVTGIGTLAQQAKLEAVQVAYLRRLLKLQSRSQKCILFTETGLWPLLYRRLYIQLGYLQYICQQDSDRLVVAALQSQIALDRQKTSGWLSDLRSNLLKVDVTLPGDITGPLIAKCMTDLKTAMQNALRNEVNNSPKLELLQRRVEFSAKGRAESPVLLFRSYLRIHDWALRQALTRLLVSDHRLSIEILRRAPAPIPREERLCRFCVAAVEDPIHALFECNCSLELVTLRR